MTIIPIILAAGLLLFVAVRAANQRSGIKILVRVKKISDTADHQSKDQFKC